MPSITQCEVSLTGSKYFIIRSYSANWYCSHMKNRYRLRAGFSYPHLTSLERIPVECDLRKRLIIISYALGYIEKWDCALQVVYTRKGTPCGLVSCKVNVADC